MAAFVAALSMLLVGVAPAAQAAPVPVTILFQDSDSNPLSNMGVVIDDMGLQTDGSGRVVWPLEPGAHRARANDAVGLYPRDWHPIAVGESGAQDFTITLERHASVTGTVPPDAVPLSISLRRWNGSAWADSGGVFFIHDPSGRFELPIEAGPGTYTVLFDVAASSPYFDTWLGPALTEGDPDISGSSFTVTRAGQVHDLGAVELFREATIEGTVYEGDGATPIPYAYLTAWSPGIGLNGGHAGSDGAYSLRVHPAHPWTLHAEADGFGDMYYTVTGGSVDASETDEISIANGATAGGFDLVLPALGTIKGTVFESDGTTPVPHAEVSAEPADGSSGVRTTAGPDGRYTVRVHPHRSWILDASAPGYRYQYYDGVREETLATPVTAPEGGVRRDIDFRLEDAASFILGFVVDAPDLELEDPGTVGELVGGIAHLYQRNGTAWSEVDTYALDGELELDGFPVGFFGFPSSILVPDSYFDPEQIDDGLEPGDYRVFFSQSGEWIPILAWFAGGDRLGPDAEDERQGEGLFCYLDAAGLASGLQEVFVAAVSSAQATDDCAPATVNKPATPAPPVKPAPPKAPGTGTPIGSVPDAAGEDETNGEQPAGVEEKPAPQPSHNAGSSAGPDQEPDPIAADGASGFDALPWMLALFALLVIGGGAAVVAVRRRS